MGDDDDDHRHDPSTISDEMKRMGQRIDIANDYNDYDDEMKSSSSTPVTNDEEEKEKHDAMKRERARRGEEIRTELRSMGASDLLGMIFRAQQERVATYKLFEEGLSAILASGNITTYPAVCAKATASFSVLSDTINAVKSSVLENNDRGDIANVIARLQKDEGEKLNLTAALHLERLRLRNSKLEGMISQSSSSRGGGDDTDGGDDQRTVNLLKAGIRSLERNVSDAVERINESLDELRCIAADEM